MDFVNLKSLATLNNTGLLINIYFYKKLGIGKIFVKGLFDKLFINSLNIIINLIKNKFPFIYKRFKNYNIYINFKPELNIKSGCSINLSIFLGLISILYNININKNLLILGNINKYGKILSIDCINLKLNALNNINCIILPKNNFINLIKLFKKNFYNLYIIKLSNILELMNLIKFDIY